MKSIQPILLVLALIVPVTLAVPAKAQGPDRHPEYLHALSDLRLMRAYLDKLTPSERIDDESMRAIDEIDAAIRAIKAAAIDDGKDIHEHMPIDAHIRPTDRFHKAREAGNAALADISHSEDDRFAGGLKHKAAEHIEHANQIVDHIIHRIDRM